MSTSGKSAARDVERAERADRERIDSVERQVAALQAEAPEPEPEVDTQLAAQAEREHDQRRFEELRQSHASELRNENWAGRMSSTIREAVDRKREARDGTFSVVDIDCRSTQCAVTAQWPSHREATAQFRDIRRATREAGVRCNSSVTLPEPESEDSAYVATVYFHGCK